MYAGGRGDATARRFARGWAAVFALGLAPKRWVTLEVVGRRSGRVVRFPLGMADWDGQWYLVAMLGENCNWVQNVRAGGGRATLKHRRAVACQLVEVPGCDRPPILRRYLDKVPGARPHIPVDCHAPTADFVAVSSRYPVFRVVLDTTPDSTPAASVGKQLEARPLCGRPGPDGVGRPAPRRGAAEEVAAVLAPLGLRLAPEKTRVVHVDEGFDFLGFHIRRMRKRGTSKYYVYTKPSRKAVQAIRDKVKAKTYRSTRHLGLDELITSLNRSLAGWANYFRYGVSKATFSAIDHFTWGRLMRWIRAKYAGKHRLGMTELRRRFCDQEWRFACNGVVFTGASSVAVKRYRYRGSKIPTPWTSEPAAANSS